MGVAGAGRASERATATHVNHSPFSGGGGGQNEEEEEEDATYFDGGRRRRRAAQAIWSLTLIRMCHPSTFAFCQIPTQLN